MYVGGQWLRYDDRAEYIRNLRDELDLLIALIESGADVTNSDLDRIDYLSTELKRAEDVHRGERDVLFFGYRWFSEYGNPDNPENLIPISTPLDKLPENFVDAVNVLAPDFHKELCAMLNDVAAGKITDNIAWACPRGHAKTAWLSNIFLVHQIVYRHRKYIVVVSETSDVAGDFIAWGKNQLKFNDSLRDHFGELLSPRATMNELDNKWEFITASRTKVEAKGLGTQTRGLRHGNSRPDLFILDDLESKDSTNTRELIEKNKRWFTEEMLEALSASGMCVYLGTILCYGSLLHYVINERKDFRSRLFGAVKKWSPRKDLWDKWREIYTADDENSPVLAREFFEEHKEEMLEGTEVLWDGYRDYYFLMTKLVNNGVKGFNQEYQNNPTDEERQIFKPEYFHFYDDADITGKNIRFYSGVDIGMGKTAGDYTVIVTIAKNEDTDVCYVHDVYMQRVHPNVLIDEMVKHAIKYQYERIGVEAQFAQEFIADKMREELQRHGYPGSTRIKNIKQRTRKEIRIEALLPDIQNGKLRFSRRIPNSVMEQFYLFKMHEHDDFPDAVAMAYDTALSGSSYVSTVRTVNRWSGSGEDRYRRAEPRRGRRYSIR